MKKRISAVVLALLMLLGGASCTKIDDQKKIDDTADYETTDSQSSADENEEKDADPVVPVAFALNKIGSVDRSVTADKTGLSYTNNSRHGYYTYDGKKGTGEYRIMNGAIYRKYLCVGDISIDEASSIDDINSLGLVRVDGEVLLPAEYAKIDVLSERYAVAYTVTEETENKDEAMLYMKKGLFFDLSVPDDAKMYKGTWQVFDVINNTEVKDANGTRIRKIEAYGDILHYYNDNSEEFYVNLKGEKLTDGDNTTIVYHYTNTYSIQNDNILTMYNAEGEKLFEMDVNKKDIGNVTVDINGGLKESIEMLLVDDYNTDTEYYIDLSGNKITDEYPRTGKMTYYGGGLYSSGNTYYDMQGNVVFEGNDDTDVSIDEVTNSLYFVKDKETYRIISIDGEVLFETSLGGEVQTDNTVIPYIKKDDLKYYYSFKDKDFTLKGNGYGWFVSTKTEDGYKLVDSYSGETVLESEESFGCSVATDPTDNVTYICFKPEQDITDVYEVTIK